MNKNKILKALKEGKTLKWNDPDPIDDSDYTISKIHEIWDEGALIDYNGGTSMAEVLLSEISIVTNNK